MEPLSYEALEQLFVKARTHYGWTDRPISDETLRAIYDLMKYGPTSANSSPARLVFVKSPDEKERLIECAAAGNIEKIRQAPVTVIVAEDIEFYEQLPRLYPPADARSWFAGNPALIEATAFRNSSLQGAYMIMAARALGLDCGPLSGFDNARVDQTFFEGTTWRSNFLCNIGYGDHAKLYPRLPRLDFDEACRII